MQGRIGNFMLNPFYWSFPAKMKIKLFTKL